MPCRSLNILKAASFLLKVLPVKIVHTLFLPVSFSCILVGSGFGALIWHRFLTYSHFSFISRGTSAWSQLSWNPEVFHAFFK